jgi:hypothetical protein
MLRSSLGDWVRHEPFVQSIADVRRMAVPTCGFFDPLGAILVLFIKPRPEVETS